MANAIKTIVVYFSKTGTLKTNLIEKSEPVKSHFNYVYIQVYNILN